MAVAGIGIDLIEIDRLEAALARRPGLGERLFSDAERAYAAARARPAQHLAARFCAKEAVAKSLGLEGWSFRDIEIIPGAPPTVTLSGRTATRANDRGVTIHISLTHSRNTAAAVASAVALPG